MTVPEKMQAAVLRGKDEQLFLSLTAREEVAA